VGHQLAGVEGSYDVLHEPCRTAHQRTVWAAWFACSRLLCSWRSCLMLFLGQHRMLCIAASHADGMRFSVLARARDRALCVMKGAVRTHRQPGVCVCLCVYMCNPSGPVWCSSLLVRPPSLRAWCMWRRTLEACAVPGQHRGSKATMAAACVVCADVLVDMQTRCWCPAVSACMLIWHGCVGVRLSVANLHTFVCMVLLLLCMLLISRVAFVLLDMLL
jgi:hypothetical protein